MFQLFKVILKLKLLVIFINYVKALEYSMAKDLALNQLTQTYAICSLFMFLKYFFCLIYGANWSNHPPEDTEKLGDRPVPEDIKRRERCFLNDVENIPLHLVLFWAAYLVCFLALSSGKGEEEALGLLILFAIYTGSRTLYTICYIFGLQPWRTIVFGIANLSVVTSCCMLISLAFKMDGSKLVRP
jgi:uncharacterized MAPEG superfamily protein